MVAINFNVFGHDFERGLMILRDSLTAAIGALDEKRKEISGEYEVYETAVAAGAERTGQWDEEAGWIWEQSQFFDYDLELIEETKSSLRKTHAVSIYHLWERVIRHWTNTHGHENHDRLVEKARAAGLAVHDRMKVISRLNNALKHNSQYFGPLLLAEWPELFPADFAETRQQRIAKAAEDHAEGRGNGEVHTDWFEVVNISDKHMDEIFSIVRESGPRANTPY